MKRGYQYNFSSTPAGMHDLVSRERKAKTMVAILEDFLGKPLNKLSVLDVGGSAGVIDNYLADHFLSVIGIDIDEPAIELAKNQFKKTNLEFQLGDAMQLSFSDNTFDVVVCSQIYEHVPSPERMIAEIARVLVPGGVCYFAASNRLMWNEPHYNLPLLSAIPRPLAHLYIKLAKKAEYYYEQHYTYWGLKKLVMPLILNDYSEKVISNPDKFHVDYMIQNGSLKAAIAKFIISRIPWISPGYIWLLEKPEV